MLKEVEQGLQEIAEIQGENVNEIIRLVNENEEILNQMKANMRQTFACAIANVVMRSDSKMQYVYDSTFIVILFFVSQVNTQ